ncbi:C1B-like aminopeptidase [Bodo saltans virus]|uniref:C1B-like aminopeptidase n=1 Tax=Bodo saltans virus TaxID=2024608 RepID=A0A2H4UTL8_9VIRU|nr:C1B-like aminopeptidase [Bodo saltans virus]ATZ80281.1 C1B-like aminopeptidase [Bodo saltans virus]
MAKRQRENNNDDDDVIDLKLIEESKEMFNSDKHNLTIQNALCSNSLVRITEVREYMQSRDKHFTYTLDPKLVVANQGFSGRCWMFAVLNVMRHELIRKYQLKYDFQLSESYVSFYDKLEICNHTMSYFINKGEYDNTSLKDQIILKDCCDDGGHWITCSNLIEKYGIIPQTCFRESVHSFDTDELNEIIGYKTREACHMILNENNKKKKREIKKQALKTVYGILCKMLGTPPLPNETLNWQYTLRQDTVDKLSRENKRLKKNGEFEIFDIKKEFKITPLMFYRKFIVHKFSEYMRFGNDPRNKYNCFYQSYNDNNVVGGMKNGFFNLDMDTITHLCVKSIKNNTPIEFDCDVEKYAHKDEELLDIKCLDFSSTFEQSLYGLSKSNMINMCASEACHAMVIVGVSFDNDKTKKSTKKSAKKPTKWKIENSWGRNYGDEMLDEDDDSGYYTMSQEWFEKYVYNVVIHQDYVHQSLKKMYYDEFKKPITLPDNDLFC